MEGVGARLGRSSTRYGPATVFSGPVRKWKKKWVHVSPSNNNANHSQNHHLHTSSANGASNGNNGSHLLLYKWTPLTQSNKDANSNAEKNSPNEEATPLPEEPPKRKFKYIPIYLLEREKKEAEDEAKLSDAEPTALESTPKSDGFDEKPDINDVPMDQDEEQVVRQDLNESTLDLSLGLKSGDDDSDSKPDGQLERVNSSSVGS